MLLSDHIPQYPTPPNPSDHLHNSSTMRVLLILALGLALTAAERITQSSGNDDTMVPGKVGADVVERTLEVMRTACVFEDDKLFMRRLAYAESFDGAKSGTFKDGYHGGIWQVRNSFFCTLTHLVYWSRFQILG